MSQSNVQLMKGWNEPVWASQPFETEDNHKAFSCFKDLPSRYRCLQEVASLCKVSHADIINLSHAHHWRHRIEQYEGFVSRGNRRLLHRGKEDQAARHMAILDLGYEVAEREWRNLLHRQRELDAMGPGCTVLKPSEVQALVNMIVKLERLVKGEVTERMGEEFDLSEFTNEELTQWTMLTAKATKKLT